MGKWPYIYPYRQGLGRKKLEHPKRLTKKSLTKGLFYKGYSQRGWYKDKTRNDEAPRHTGKSLSPLGLKRKRGKGVSSANKS